jgi:hypothetical protein
LNQILNENIEEKNGKVQKKKEHVKDKLVSLVDKDARHGAKSPSIEYVPLWKLLSGSS